MHIFITSCQQVCGNYDSEYRFHLWKNTSFGTILKVCSEFSSLFLIKLHQNILQMLCRILRESNENSDVIKNWKFLELHENHEEMFFTASLLFLKINERSLNLILVKCIYKHFLAHIFTTSCKGHSLCKQCLHDLQFMTKGSSSPNLSKLKVAFFQKV